MTRKKHEWIDVTKEKPRSSRWYDLCLLDLGDKCIKGWWTGAKWAGLRYKGEDVKRWQFCNVDTLNEW